MKKYIKFLIIIFIIIIFLVILNNVLEKPIDEKITNFIITQGYKLDPNTTMYSKKVSNNNLIEYKNYVNKKIDSIYEINYFDNYNYKLIKEKLEYYDGIETSLIENYSYRDETLTFTYRIILDNVNAIYKGTYDISNKKLTCNKDFSYGLTNTSIENTICTKIEYDLKEFSLEAITLITNNSFIDYIKNKEIE